MSMLRPMTMRTMPTLLHARGFRAGAQRQADESANIIFKTDHNTKALSLYHKVNIALLGVAPLAMAVGPSMLSMPLDLALGVALPLHAHFGLNSVISDYAHKIHKLADPPLRVALVAFTGVTLLGMLKLNLAGPGLTESVKALWRPKKAD